MKKAIVLLLIASATIFAAVAQQSSDIKVKSVEMTDKMPIQFNFGVKVGANLSGITPNESTGSILGFMTGGFAEMRASTWFSLSIDVLFSVGGYGLQDNAGKNVNSYVVAPVLANFYVFDNLALKAGIQPGILIDARQFSNGVENSNIGDYNRFDLAIPVGISYAIEDRYILDLRYNIGLSKIDKGGNPAKNSIFSLSFGYRF